ncbi:UNVERIFIED_CONTAM: hypothetical protein GTU68_062221, partial [Idotea baltica]|nr:hypothetical protein [Idotea baltica]
MDAGLRAHMSKVYGYLGGGLALAAVVAYVVGSNEAMVQAIWGSGLRWAVIFAPLAFIMLISFGINKMSLAMTQAAYWTFTALMGLSLSAIVVRFADDPTIIAKAFLITSISFMAMSLYGYTTNKSLSGWGSFLFMGVIGIILAMIVNMFLGSSALGFAISVIGVLIFAGLTAYDTQQMKNEY